MGYSLHRVRRSTVCHHCGESTAPGGEVWRYKGPRSQPGARIVCVLCHVLSGAPTDGWTEPADGETVIAGLVPERGRAASSQEEPQ